MQRFQHQAPILMLIGSTFPLAFIFLAPMFGLNGRLALLIVIVAVFVCHLVFMAYMKKAGGDQNPPNLHKEDQK
ncbi:MAG: hypothetical protein DWQ47_11810 [Acidobacteria bacterium]|nr:MAG: hypothetical protein DWQ43_02070 [Acidobacteriota bacterium]REK42911.1 MAG: hypothetical protein DWQ47_11810 [Acidobacteriota bacterium]